MAEDIVQAARAAPMARRLVEWMADIYNSEIRSDSLDAIMRILLDTLACALNARADRKFVSALSAVRALGGAGDCTVIASNLRTSLPLAAFANGVMVRTLDFNDAYVGPRQIGHPSDNIPTALAAAEKADRSGRDVLRAIRLGYEFYGRLLDMSEPDGAWDHVTVSGLTSAAILGPLLSLTPEQQEHALSLTAMHCATLGEVRVGHVSGAKSIANAVVVQTACFLTLLAAQGVTGPSRAIEGARGFARLMLDGGDFERFFASGDDRIARVGLKPYPCFALGQGPISAAVELRRRLGGSIDKLQKLRVSIADTGPARLRLKDLHGQRPNSREAADHSLYFLVAVALLDGEVGLAQFENARWEQRTVVDLMARIEAEIDPRLTPASALPCRLEAVLADGTTLAIDRAASPGSAAAPLSSDEARDKFLRASKDVLNKDEQRKIIELVGELDRLPSIRTLMNQLANPRGGSGRADHK